MNIFFGKIASKRFPAQFSEGYYDTDSKSWFNGINIGDYAFAISGAEIELWQAQKWEKDGFKLVFNKIVTGIEGQTAKFIAFKYFKLFPALISGTTKSLRNIAFVPIPLAKEISESDLTNQDTYQKEENFRRILVLEKYEDCDPDSEDVQVYDDNGKWNIYQAPFMEGDTFEHFRDNTDHIGGGRAKKDKTLKTFLDIGSLPKTFSHDVLNIRNLYEAFAVPYESKEEPEEEGTSPSPKPNNNVTTIKWPLNQILYGPPGTGKTYNSIKRSLEILEESDLDWDDRVAVKKRFDKRMEEGRIVFTTFHQSMTYEDFIEGIKPVKPDGGMISYEVKKGIFREICDRAMLKTGLRNFETIYNKFIEDVMEAGELNLVTPTQSKPFRVVINSSRNPVAIPSTGAETRLVVTKEMILEFMANGNILDWKPYTTSISNYIKSKYSLEKTSLENINLPYVLIIDEINRGNISQIFGELITLLEDDKRIGEREALRVKLPYSKDEAFGVPPNLYIIGTMNTADRSVEALDTALRRRFSFEEMAPEPELLTPNNQYWALLKKYDSVPWNDKTYKEKEKRLLDFLGATNVIWDTRKDIWKRFEDNKGQDNFPSEEFTGINLKTILSKINTRIEKLLDADHQIGHSYFINVATLDELKEVFYRKVIPLMQEYFYGDYGKIAMVLGPGFVQLKDEKQDVEFAFEYDGMPDFSGRPVFKIIRHTDDAQFQEAIRLLVAPKNTKR